MSWNIISSDLTRNDKQKQQASGGPITKDNTGVEVYDTIFSVVESSAQKDLIWAGTDDGLLHITRDGGQHWENVTPRAMPEWATVSMIEASAKDAGTAYIAAERHKMDDFTPYIFKTTDFGKTWSKLANGLPPNAYVHAVRVDPRHPGLLFAGTESGVFVSFNDGEQWQPLQLNLPVTPVNDLLVKNNDLVVATHGRSFWVLDDITALEQYGESVTQDAAHLFTPAAANHTLFRGSFFRGGANTGKNPPAGAVIDYWLKTSLKKADDKKESEKKEGDSKDSSQNAASKESAAGPDSKGGDSEAPKITLDILDSSGKVIRHFPKKEEDGDEDEGFGAPDRNAGKLPVEAGLNRFVWDLDYEGASKVPHAPLWGGSTSGPRALPGIYQVKLTVLGKSYTAPLEITPDSRLTVTQADLEKQFALLMKIRDKVTETDDAINQIRDLREQMTAINKRLKNDPRGKSIADAGKSLDKKMTEVEEALIQTKAKSGQDVLNFPVRLNNHLVALSGVVGSADSAPTKQSYEVFDMLSKAVDQQLTKWKAIVSTDVKAYDDLVKQQEIPALIVKQVADGR
jgi:photosystem II stability/assembly factor-like uncharacterized protein